jgi:hypothetical protein
MSTHQVRNLKRMQLMNGEESCIRMAWSLMGRCKRDKQLHIPGKRIKRKLHENDMISDGYKRNKQLQIPEKNQKIITQTFTEKKVSCTALCTFRTLALTCCIASCLSPTPLLPTPFFSLNSHLQFQLQPLPWDYVFSRRILHTTAIIPFWMKP